MLHKNTTDKHLQLAIGLRREHTGMPELDLVCFSHLRWDFVYQRPQHLLSRAAQSRRVLFIEEPHYDAARPCLETRRDPSGVTIAIPHLPRDAGAVHLQTLLDFLLSAHDITDFVAWYYTPMALDFTAHLRPIATVYDCMDELSAFAGAPPGLRDKEQALLRRADLVLTGGRSLYEAKRSLHVNVHECPSSVDVPHFARARRHSPIHQINTTSRIHGSGSSAYSTNDSIATFSLAWPSDVQTGSSSWSAPLRRSATLICRCSRTSTTWDRKAYGDLPSYIAGWDVAMLPFARNDATRFISPTKTPEYLAAGKPVVSTSIPDVVRPYGDERLARIADTPDDFVDAIRAALSEPTAQWLPQADAFLVGTSWDATWAAIAERVRAAVRARQTAQTRVIA